MSVVNHEKEARYRPCIYTSLSSIGLGETKDHCLTANDKFACSNNELQEYIAENWIKYPEPAVYKGQEGLEYVTFTLDKNGKFEGNLKVISKDKPCEGCADKAADIVANMEDMWYPAIKNGETVKTELTIPVRFELLDN